MKIIRAICAGAFAWTLVFTTFVLLSFIPLVKDSELQQFLIVSALVIPFAALGALFYYRSGEKTHALVVGIVMSATALTLDSLITVPLMVIPKGGSYASFFTAPILWILVAIQMVTIAVYWKFKVKNKPPLLAN